MNAILTIEHFMHQVDKKPKDMPLENYNKYMLSKKYLVKLIYWDDGKDAYMILNRDIDIKDMFNLKTFPSLNPFHFANHSTRRDSRVYLHQSGYDYDRTLSDKLFMPLKPLIEIELNDLGLDKAKLITHIVIKDVDTVVRLFNIDDKVDREELEMITFDIPHVGPKSFRQLSYSNRPILLTSKQQLEFVNVTSAMYELITLNLLTREKQVDTEFHKFYSENCDTFNDQLHKDKLMIMYNSKGKILFTNHFIGVRKRKKNRHIVTGFYDKWQYICKDATKTALFKKYIKWENLLLKTGAPIPFTFTTYPTRVKEI